MTTPVCVIISRSLPYLQQFESELRLVALNFTTVFLRIPFFLPFRFSIRVALDGV